MTNILIKKDFLTELKQTICCTESGGNRYCRVDDFCAGDPRLWPSVETNAQTQISDSGKDSIYGKEDFCSGYKDWYKGLAGREQNVPGSIASLYAASSGRMAEIRRGTKPLRKGEPPRFTSPHGQRFGEDIQEIAEFCGLLEKGEGAGLQPAEQQKGEVPAEKPPSSVNYAKWGKIGAAVLLALTALWIAVTELRDLWRSKGPKGSYPKAEAGKKGFLSTLKDLAVFIIHSRKAKAELVENLNDPALQILGETHEALVRLRKYSDELRRQPYFVQLYVEELVVSEWRATGNLDPYPPSVSSKMFVREKLGKDQLDEMNDDAWIWVNEEIAKIWGNLHPSIKGELGYDLLAPPGLLHKLKKLPEELTTDPMTLFARTADPVGFDVNLPRVHDDFNLDEVMVELIKINPDLEFYPNLLLHRAKAVAESWKEFRRTGGALTMELSVRSFTGEGPHHFLNSVPVSFVRLWYHTHVRGDIDRISDDDPKDPKGGLGGGSAAGGGVTGTSPSGETSGTPDDDGSFARQSTDYGNLVPIGFELFAGTPASALFMMQAPWALAPAMLPLP